MAELDVCMTGEEAGLLREVSRDRRHVVEFGCGGSTVLFLENGVELVDSVESDRAWAARVCGEPRVAAALRSDRFRMHAVDIGLTKAWGHPVDDSSKALWPDYPREIWRKLDPPAVDFVLIDGRFRVACALAALRHVGGGALIAVHDFWTRPQAYGELLDFLEVIHRAGSLAIFGPRGAVDEARIEERVERYLGDPR